MKAITLKMAALIVFAMIGASCVGRVSNFLDLHLIPGSEYAIIAGNQGLMWIFTAPLGGTLGAITGFTFASCCLRELVQARLACTLGGSIMAVLLSLFGFDAVWQHIHWPSSGSGECIETQDFISKCGLSLIWSIFLMVFGFILQHLSTRTDNTFISSSTAL